MQKDMFGKSVSLENKMIMRVFVMVLLLMPCLLKAQTKKIVTKNVVTTSTSSSLKTSVARGQIVYTKICLTCHQVDGSGVPMMNPPLIKTKWVLGPKNILIRQVLKGSSGTVEIDGDTFRNTMPPQPQLTDLQIADVLTYVRNSFGNKASAVTVAEVKAMRAKTK
jgi:mono/diheme cytochrome c family protein